MKKNIDPFLNYSVSKLDLYNKKTRTPISGMINVYMAYIKCFFKETIYEEKVNNILDKMERILVKNKKNSKELIHNEFIKESSEYTKLCEQIRSICEKYFN